MTIRNAAVLCKDFQGAVAEDGCDVALRLAGLQMTWRVAREASKAFTRLFETDDIEPRQPTPSTCTVRQGPLNPHPAENPGFGVGTRRGILSAVHEDEMTRERARYTLTEAEHGHAWGICADLEGLFGEPQRRTYELFEWVREKVEMPAWVGSRVWLVPDDETLDAWLLEDAESMGRGPTGSLLLTGLDD